MHKAQIHAFMSSVIKRESAKVLARTTIDLPTNLRKKKGAKYSKAKKDPLLHAEKSKSPKIILLSKIIVLQVLRLGADTRIVFILIVAVVIVSRIAASFVCR